MNATQPSSDPKPRDGATSPDDPDDRSSAGSGGGAPAAEEDIGTEGAGTEPRRSVDVERDTGEPSRRERNDKETP
jgi:hypothetical protein